MLAALRALLRRTRQHHAIEHATLTLLAERYPGRRLAGYSDPAGVSLLTDLPQPAVRRALTDALARLQAGEARLAIHPFCGTNLLATALLATTLLTTVAALLDRRGAAKDPLSRFGVTGLVLLPVLLLGPMAGMWLQRYTTLASIQERRCTELRPLAWGRLKGYRIVFG